MCLIFVQLFLWTICFWLSLTEGRVINSELWHACAGPLVAVPPVGSLVVYFPQGHSEQVWQFPFMQDLLLMLSSFFYWSYNYLVYDVFFGILFHCLQVAASMQKETDGIPSYPNLPSKLICMLHNVTLHVRQYPCFSISPQCISWIHDIEDFYDPLFGFGLPLIFGRLLR